MKFSIHTSIFYALIYFFINKEIFCGKKKNSIKFNKFENLLETSSICIKKNLFVNNQINFKITNLLKI